MIHGDYERGQGNGDQNRKNTGSRKGNTQGSTEVRDETRTRQGRGEDEDEARTRMRQGQGQGQGQGEGEDKVEVNRVMGQRDV